MVRKGRNYRGRDRQRGDKPRRERDGGQTDGNQRARDRPRFRDSVAQQDDRFADRQRNMPSMMRRMFLGATAEVSVFVRTDNAEGYLEELLESLRNQQIPHEVEVIAVDCGSTDRTPLILRSRGIRALHVERGADYMDTVLRAAEGEVMVFLEGETLPIDSGWLLSLVAPLFENEKTVLAYGRLVVDTSVSALHRGLIGVRPYLSGRTRIHFQGSKAPGATYLPATNFGIRKKALEEMGQTSRLSQTTLEKWFLRGYGKVYLPEAPAVLKAALPIEPLLDPFAALAASTPRAALCEAVALFKELYQLSSNDTLSRGGGERGDAYAEAILLHTTRMVRHKGTLPGMLRKLMGKTGD